MSAKVKQEKGPTLTVAREQLAAFVSEIRDAIGNYNVAFGVLAVAIAQATALVAAVPKVLRDGEDFAAFLVRQKVDLGSWDLSNLRSVGRVIIAIGDDRPIDGSVSPSALIKLNRLMPKGDMSEQNVSKVRKVWRKASDTSGRATIGQVEKALAELYPDAEGSRGPSKGSESAKGNGKGKGKGKTSAAKTAAAPSEPTPDEPSGSLVKSALTRIGTIAAQAVAANGEGAVAPAMVTMAATVQACSEFGVPAMVAAVQQLETATEAKAAAKVIAEPKITPKVTKVSATKRTPSKTRRSSKTTTKVSK